MYNKPNNLFSNVLTILSFLAILLASNAHATDVELSWNKPDDDRVVGYNIYCGKSGTDFTAAPVQTIHSADQTSCLILNLEEGQAYEFAATSFDIDNHESDFSEIINYFVVVTVIDSDGDGFTAAEGDCNDNEASIYPGAVEICGDGIDQDCDGYDLACVGDTDNDGLSDDDEINIYGTSPIMADTDNDGIEDGEEVAYWIILKGTNGWMGDYDGDGIDNNLLDNDADGDTYLDGVEKDGAFDPKDPRSFPETLDNSRLIIRSDAAEGSTIFTDNSSAGHTIIANGNVQHGQTAVYDSSVIVYDGAGDCLTMADSDDWNFGTDDFTIALWINADATGSYRGIISTLDKLGSSGLLLYIQNGALKFYNAKIGMADTGFSVAADEWYHLAAVRSGNTLSVYVDGVVEYQTDCSGISFDSGGAGLAVGKVFVSKSAYCFDGYMDEINVTKGEALWTDNFMPTDCPDIPGHPVEKDSTRLIIRSDATDGNTTFTDSSSAGHTIVANGNVQHGGSDVYGSTVITYDGEGDSLNMAGSDDWNFGTDDFTIALWMNADATGSYRGIISTLDKLGSSGLLLYIQNGSLKFYNAKIGMADTGFSVAADEWYHLAAVRSGNTLSVYVDGVVEYQTDCSGISFDSGGAGLAVGKVFVSKSAYCFDGYMDEITVTKGEARWTGNFIPTENPGN